MPESIILSCICIHYADPTLGLVGYRLSVLRMRFVSLMYEVTGQVKVMVVSSFPSCKFVYWSSRLSP